MSHAPPPEKRPLRPRAQRSVAVAWREPRIAIPLVAYMGLVFLLSHTSHPPLPKALLSLSDKFLHTVEYVPLGFLWASLFRGPARRRVLLGWLAACLFGLTDELHQAFVPGREVSALDWAADALGSGLGALLAAVVWPAVRRNRKKTTSG